MTLRTRLAQRAAIIEKLHRFFKERDVLQVTTPILGKHTIPDPNIESFELFYQGMNHYLQTSPEFDMKRLLAQGSGSIYQINQAFRREESGRYHAPEFTLLEWYRLNFDHLQLIEEVDALLQCILGTPPLKKKTYQSLFKDILGINPFDIEIDALSSIAKEKVHASISSRWTLDELLDLLFCECIEPELSKEISPVAVYHFPVSKAALARLITDNEEEVAARFEVFMNGIELANGFFELADPDLQRQRFIRDNEIRMARGQSAITIDEDFLMALADLPECSGVALGIDRLLMLALGEGSIHDLCHYQKFYKVNEDE